MPKKPSLAIPPWEESPPKTELPVDPQIPTAEWRVICETLPTFCKRNDINRSALMRALGLGHKQFSEFFRLDNPQTESFVHKLAEVFGCSNEHRKLLQLGVQSKWRGLRAHLESQGLIVTTERRRNL